MTKSEKHENVIKSEQDNWIASKYTDVSSEKRRKAWKTMAITISIIVYISIISYISI